MNKSFFLQYAEKNREIYHRDVYCLLGTNKTIAKANTEELTNLLKANTVELIGLTRWVSEHKLDLNNRDDMLCYDSYIAELKAERNACLDRLKTIIMAQ